MNVHFISDLVRFQKALDPLNLELRVTFDWTSNEMPLDLDVHCRCWCPNHKTSEPSDPTHVTGINANEKNFKERLHELKDQVERYTGCLVDYV